MQILPVILGLVIVLDGKLGATVQTAQAHDAVFLIPAAFPLTISMAFTGQFLAHRPQLMQVSYT